MLTCAPRYSSSVAITPKIIPSTSHAARVCEPKNRDLRPSRCGSFRSRITPNVMIPARTATANRSSMNPVNAQCPIHGMENVRENRAPNDSMIVSSKTVKPQNVGACAVPGTVHFSSLRCPITSVVSVATSLPGCARTAAIRSGAGCPLPASRFSHHSRRPAIANATTVRTRPTVIRKTTRTSSISGAQA